MKILRGVFLFSVSIYNKSEFTEDCYYAFLPNLSCNNRKNRNESSLFIYVTKCEKYLPLYAAIKSLYTCHLLFIFILSDMKDITPVYFPMVWFEQVRLLVLRFLFAEC